MVKIKLKLFESVVGAGIRLAQYTVNFASIP